MSHPIRRLGLSSDWRDLADTAIDQGWKLDFTNNGHVKWIPPHPAGKIIFSAGSPSDFRAIVNTRAKLRRQGLKT